MTRCDGCGEEIKWIKTPRGKSAPLDAKPVKMWVHYMGEWQMRDCYTSHFATCPQAGMFRKPKGEE